MGRVEKKFQKKKDREREVHKKILKKRAASRALDKQVKKQNLLERKASKNQPIRRQSPELQKTLESLNKLTEDAFKENDVEIAPVRGKSKWLESTEVTEFAPEPGK